MKTANWFYQNGRLSKDLFPICIYDRVFDFQGEKLLV